MNDFTKEELQIIKYGVDLVNVRKHGQNPITPYLDLMRKIQAMIESYCEHERVKYCSDCVTETCIRCKKRW